MKNAPAAGIFRRRARVAAVNRSSCRLKGPNRPDRRPKDAPARCRRAVRRGDVRHAAVEVFVQREQCVWPQFAEDFPQILLNSIHGVKEVAAVHLQAPATQPPIRAKQEVKGEQPVFRGRKRSARDEGEVGDVLFVLPAPCPVAAPRGVFQRHLAQVLFFGCAMAKSGVASPEYGAIHAVACLGNAALYAARACAETIGAVRRRQSQCLRSGPLHLQTGPFVGLLSTASRSGESTLTGSVGPVWRFVNRHNKFVPPLPLRQASSA